MKKGLDYRLFLLVIVGLRGSKCDNDESLTSAVTVDATTPKPTSIFRRILFDTSVTETERAPLDLFRFRVQEIRRTDGDVWNWDSWCQLQPKTGNGTATLNRFYYDTQIDQCLAFTYSGSQGNKNNFQTLGDCERYCQGSAYMTTKETTKSIYCSLQPHSGLCLGMFEKYYYDVNEGRCKNFIYGGCGGNQNRFNGLNECMSRCSPDHDTFSDRY